MKGWLKIVGLGPGDENLVTPQVLDALSKASDVIGYYPYIARVAEYPSLRLHSSDNRAELDRAKHALQLALEGNKVVVVSSGDPGVFAMAAAVFEAIEKGPENWRKIEIDVLPGITAMLAAAARVGAPLGHDFCTINLSDNLKPWEIIEKRLRLAAEADFAMAFYNPSSKSRPKGFEKALRILNAVCKETTPVIFARAVSSSQENINVVPLTQATPQMADMRTIVIVGSSQTRIIQRPDRRPFVYTPRFLSP